MSDGWVDVGKKRRRERESERTKAIVTEYCLYFFLIDRNRQIYILDIQCNARKKKLKCLSIFKSHLMIDVLIRGIWLNSWLWTFRKIKKKERRMTTATTKKRRRKKQWMTTCTSLWLTWNVNQVSIIGNSEDDGLVTIEQTNCYLLQMNDEKKSQKWLIRVCASSDVNTGESIIRMYVFRSSEPGFNPWYPSFSLWLFLVRTKSDKHSQE